jgi:hypothetical protein
MELTTHTALGLLSGKNVSIPGVRHGASALSTRQ